MTKYSIDTFVVVISVPIVFCLVGALVGALVEKGEYGGALIIWSLCFWALFVVNYTAKG